MKINCSLATKDSLEITRYEHMPNCLKLETIFPTYDNHDTYIILSKVDSRKLALELLNLAEEIESEEIK